ncbi:MAG: hypothetical protein GW939_01835 [Candidatus Magasanikbacteria bacterium]|uniref:Haloacid dehalogenase n=1 Tax=Candidatus Magasanikbacteria bacterium CG10_big_fil_rev_8_21_14_0_10_38_6 TaxID=1974647 RepID=A0A2M6P1E4_9BACT|nr:hypothetical protein [Candidatus Magasanikbacteria bacterium]PIR77240.1 MAG: hypothetical protein COU30_03510 [Candidatus Magasanikbacteria bacterium CG10_big_fil_rev_8_21_14_0_10_38_6]
MTLQVTYLRGIKKELLDYAEKRRAVIKLADDALHISKRAIFAVHRDDMKEAKEKLAAAEALLKQIAKKYVKLSEEGSVKAAQEEYVEATLFYQFLTTKKIGKIMGMTISSKVYIAGLCDVPGELYRYAIKAATARDRESVTACARMAQDIVGELTEFNLTSYLRNKFDQAKAAVQKIEHVVYELSLKD